jgi:hypothetical protein
VSTLALLRRGPQAAAVAARSGASARPSVPEPIVAPQVRARPYAGAVVQPSMKVGAVNDPAEQEADRIADTVMRIPESSSASDGVVGRDSQQVARAPLAIQRKCTSCEAEEEGQTIARKPMATGGVPTVTPQIRGGIEHAQRLGGSGFSADSQSFFEPRFARSLSHVRLHSDATSAGLARQLGARAFTVGRDIFFGSGELQPQSARGRRLIAHELVHTLQQGGDRSLAERGDGMIRRAPSSEAASDEFQEIGVGNTVNSRAIQANVLQDRVADIKPADMRRLSTDELQFLLAFVKDVHRGSFPPALKERARTFLRQFLVPAIAEKARRTERAARLREEARKERELRAQEDQRIEKGQALLEAEPAADGFIEEQILAGLRLAERGTRKTRDAALRGLRALVDLQSPEAIAMFDPLLAEVELVTDMIIRLPLAIAGLGAGLTLGLVEELEGLLALALLPFTLVKAALDRELTALLKKIARGVADLPRAIPAAIGKWMDEYSAADDIEQTTKIAVLVGRLEALIIGAFTGAGAGKSASVALTRTTKGLREGLELAGERSAARGLAPAGGPVDELAGAAARPRSAAGLSGEELIKAEARGKAVGGTLGGATGPSQRAVADASEARQATQSRHGATDPVEVGTARSERGHAPGGGDSKQWPGGDARVRELATKAGGRPERLADGRWAFENTRSGQRSTEFSLGSHKDLKAVGANGFFESHHGVQDAWARDVGLPHYSRNEAPAILLRDTHSGTPHRAITNRQAARAGTRSNRTYADERQLLEADLTEAGVPPATIARHLAEQDAYFGKLYRRLQGERSASELERWFGVWSP